MRPTTVLCDQSSIYIDQLGLYCDQIFCRPVGNVFLFLPITILVSYII